MKENTKDGHPMKLTLAPYLLDIDQAKTKEAHRNAKALSACCSCAGCRNFEQAVKHLPDEITAFFATLGVDIAKPAEVYVNDTADGMLHYAGFYHLCGRRLQGESAWVRLTPDHAVWDVRLTHHLTDSFHIAFADDCALVRKNFPQPVIQMEIDALLPWVLDEENPY